MAKCEKARHLVVLMLENRSFDHAVGWLRTESPELDGLSGSESCPSDPFSPMPVLHPVTDDADPQRDPPVDPPHEAPDVAEQLYGTADPLWGDAPENQGFFARYNRSVPGSGAEVLRGFAPGALPALHTLAREYMLCDRWFSSVPGPTWPNRFFAHCASAGGFLDGKWRSYPMRSVFGRLDEKHVDFRIYFHDVAQSFAIDEIRTDVFRGNFRRFAAFLEDAKSGALPAYSFIEPDYGSLGVLSGAPNDQHPPHGMAGGEALIASVYAALRASPAWTSTVLLVLWDEHGGFYDHVPPPSAVPPGDGYPAQLGFAFDRLGVRVPAVIVSPWVPRGSIDHTEYDHASIPATLAALFGIDPLTDRDRAATPFIGALSLDAPRADAPLVLPALGASPVAPAPVAAPNDHQQKLLDLAAHLPGAGSAPPGAEHDVQRRHAARGVDGFLAGAR